ncbi:MAG: beta-hydroxyacyl-ACP dehydratase [Bacteroidales bacterium]|nr:beta-hydroxyacyl-ACP dehydratase [Bacteroidales bacterium]
MYLSEIKGYLPHREPMLLVESASVDASGACHASYRIPSDPFYCQGHFPGNPIVPGVILCEIMAQSCFHLMLEVFAENLVVYRGLDNVRFRGTVRPGDLTETTCTLVEQKGSLWVCDAKLSVGGKLCAQARITLAAVPK